MLMASGAGGGGVCTVVDAVVTRITLPGRKKDGSQGRGGGDGVGWGGGGDAKTRRVLVTLRKH